MPPRLGPAWLSDAVACIVIPSTPDDSCGTGVLITGSDGDDGVAGALARQCRAATSDLGLTGAVVTVRTASGAQAVAGSSDESSRRVEEIQFAVGEGPGQEAFESGQPVLVADLTPALARWPGFAPEAIRAGICAVYTFPLQFGATRFGVLSCYCDAPRTLTAAEQSSLEAFAERITETLLDSAAEEPDQPGRPDEGAELEGSLHLRTEIYQAQGMLTVQLGVSLVEALARMRAHAFATETELTALAIGILDGTIRLSRE